MSRRAGAGLVGLLPATAALLMLAVVAVPLFALVVSTSPADLLDGLRHPVALSALRLSLFTTTTSLAQTLLQGTPLAQGAWPSTRPAAFPGGASGRGWWWS